MGSDARAETPTPLAPDHVDTLLLAGDLIRLYVRSPGGLGDDALETLRATLVGWARHRLKTEQARELLAASYDMLRAGENPTTSPVLSVTAS